MTSIAAHERMLLCALAQQLGPDEPTLCGDWTIRDLVAHLLVREGSPAAVGIVVPRWRASPKPAMRRESRKDFHQMVTALRHGPPLWSPMRAAQGRRRCSTPWSSSCTTRTSAGPSPPGSRGCCRRHVEEVAWRGAKLAGKGFTKSAPVGVVIQRSDTGERARLSGGSGEVVVRGMPGELAMFVYGRQDHTRVDLSGEPDDVATLRGTDLGI